MTATNERKGKTNVDGEDMRTEKSKWKAEGEEKK